MEDKRPALVLRIDKQQHRRVNNCESYSVSMSPDGRTLISLFDSPSPTADQKPSGMISLEPDEVCYVMDSSTGLTVEHIRPKRRAAAQFRTVAK